MEFTSRFWVSTTGQGMPLQGPPGGGAAGVGEKRGRRRLDLQTPILHALGSWGLPEVFPGDPKAVLETSPAHEAQGELEKLGLKGIGGVFRRVQGCSRVLKGAGVPPFLANKERKSPRPPHTPADLEGFSGFVVLPCATQNQTSFLYCTTPMEDLLATLFRVFSLAARQGQVDTKSRPVIQSVFA